MNQHGVQPWKCRWFNLPAVHTVQVTCLCLVWEPNQQRLDLHKKYGVSHEEIIRRPLIDDTANEFGGTTSNLVVDTTKVKELSSESQNPTG